MKNDPPVMVTYDMAELKDDAKARRKLNKAPQTYSFILGTEGRSATEDAELWRKAREKRGEPLPHFSYVAHRVGDKEQESVSMNVTQKK